MEENTKLSLRFVPVWSVSDSVRPGWLFLFWHKNRTSPTKKFKEDVHTSPMYTVLYAADPLLHLILVAF